MTDTEENDRSRDRTRRDRPTRFTETSRERDRSPDRGKERGGMKSSSNRVYVSNIPYESRWQDLKDLFRDKVGDVSFVELFVDENDKPRGCGIVEFTDPEAVTKCLETMHRFELKSRKIVIKEDFGNARDKHGNIIGSGNKRKRENRDDFRGGNRYDDRRGFDQGNGGMGGSDKWGDTFGLSPSFLESLGINSPLCNRVFVANLDYKVDKKKLKEIFRLAGKVQRVELSYDKDGQSRGFAVVEYDHPVESVQAISMFHNQRLYDRTMTVRMDRANEIPKLPEGLKGIGMGLGSNGEPLKDVARNLPSSNSGGNQQGGASILGAVPTPSLLGNTALSGLNSVVGSNALSSLGTTSAMLQAAQAANLAGVGSLSNSLFGNPMGGGNLNLAALAANAGAVSGNSGSLGGNYSSNNDFNDQQNSTYQRRPTQSFTSSTGNFGNFERPNRPSGGSLFGTIGNGGQLTRVGGDSNIKSASFNSSKILISNLPPTTSFKLLGEKCNEFGDVLRTEDKGNGSVVISFNNEWEAQNAIKNLDRARIDGRTIDVRLF